MYQHGLHGSAFNVSVGTKNYIINENEKNLNYFPQHYELNTIRSVRKNQNTSVNECGQHLLDFMHWNKFSISNRRTCGDLQGYLEYVANLVLVDLIQYCIV